MTSLVVMSLLIGFGLFGVLVGCFVLSSVSPGFKRWFEKYFWGSGS